jgi:hypothetical protein
MNAWAWFEDEMPAWRDGEGANPAKERDAAIVPSLAGHNESRVYSAGTPMGTGDFHARLVALGDTAHQKVYAGPTWHWRPELTEARCRELEPDSDTFSREFGAVPFDGTTASMFTGPMLDAVTRTEPMVMLPERGSTYIAAQDPAARANAWTLAIVRARDLGEGLTMADVCMVREWRAPRGAALDSDATLAEIAGVLYPYGVGELWSDQWSFDALRPLASRHGIELLQQPSTGALNVQRFEALRRRVVDRTISLPPDPLVRQDLLGVRKWVGKGGAFTVELERVGTRHADTAPAIALAVDKAAGGPGVAFGGYLRWIEDEARAAHGLPPRRSPRAPAVAGDGPELVSLRLPARFAGTSHFLALSGTSYSIVDGRIFAKPSDVEDLQKIGFSHT